MNGIIALARPWWSLTPRQAIALQWDLAQRVSRVPPSGELRFVAGLDAAYSS